jgi:hypothetical protein
MIFTALTNAQRAPRAFKEWTRLSFQVRGGATITIAKEQGESQNQNDGIQLTQASTNPPYETWWKGELWYASNVANSQFVMLIIGTADSGMHP